MNRFGAPLGVLALVVSMGCRGPDQTIELLDYPVLELSSSWVEFGEVEHGETATRTVVIKNLGELPMGIASIEEGLGKDEDFSFTWDEALVDCPEGSEIAAEDEEGAGDEAKNVSPAPDAAIYIDVSEIDFGMVDAGTSASPAGFVIQNLGTDPLEITEISLGTTDGPFSLVSDYTGTFENGDSITGYVGYSPTTTDGDTDTITITSNDAASPHTISLLGNIEDGGGDDGDGGDDGGGDTGTDPGTVDENVELVLGAGCELPVEVSFTPVNVGDVYGSLLVKSITQDVENTGEEEYWADLEKSQAIIYLRGDGQRGNGRIGVNPRSVDFGHLWIGETSVRYVEIENIGEGDLTLGDASLDESCSTGFSISSVYSTGKMLESDQQTFVELSFVPEDTSAAYCTLHVESDDIDSPQVEVNLQGNAGSDPENKAPSVAIRSPAAGYIHNLPTAIEMELNVFDANQPATSLTCKVRSEVQLGASLTSCTPDTESGHVFVDVPIEDLDAGVDTLRVQVVDSEGSIAYASIPVVINASASESDDDGDGFGDFDTGKFEDCDDFNINTYPKAAEIYDGYDNDCDNVVDEGTEGFDDDGDTFTEADGDCHDGDSSVYPGGPESGDRLDNDCDGQVDEGTALFDDDGDGYADVNNDCNDLDPLINPSAVEYCDGEDNDCNGLVDDACLEINSEPYIVGGIDASQTAVEIGESSQLSVFVHDADGQIITYSWTFDKGSSNVLDAASVTWVAQDELANRDGELVEVYVVAQDEDSNQVWDFTRLGVYDEGELHKQHVIVTTVEN